VTLELRAGGPAIGNQQVSAQMYVDPDITLGMPKVDEEIELSAKQPTLAVQGLVQKDPQIIYWDPKTHPEFKTIADIGRSHTTVVYFDGNVYMEYLVNSGILRRDQLDGSHDGTPARFVASGGDIAVAGYATVEPYVLERVIKKWAKPIGYQLVYDAGYINWGEILAIRSGDRQALAPCLRKLVPIIQGAQ